MDISDVLFSRDTSFTLKHSILDLMEQNGITDAYMRVLTPTDSNDDVDGSQHARNGGNDFTYREITEEDLENVSGLGYYEYFSEGYTGDVITGHYYHGSSNKFEAIVINPPAYAVSVTV